MGAATADIDDGQIWKELPGPPPYVPAAGAPWKVDVCHEGPDVRVWILKRSESVRASVNRFHPKAAVLQRRHAQIEDSGVVLYVQNQRCVWIRHGAPPGVCVGYPTLFNGSGFGGFPARSEGEFANF